MDTIKSYVRGTYMGTINNVLLPSNVRAEILTRNYGPATIYGHLDDLLTPEVVNSYRYNLLSRQPERTINGVFSSTDANADKASFCITINSVLLNNGLKKCPKSDLEDIYTLFIDSVSVDPFYEKIKSLEWDGTPRMKRWFADGLGAYIPSLTDEQSDEIVGAITTAWFMSAIDRHEYHSSVAEVIPILKGGQGIGKTTFVKYTAIDDAWYKSTTIGGESPQKYFESISGGKIIEWGEAGQLRNGGDIGNLKQFISNDVDTYRAPYDKYPTTVPRLWVAIITTNDSTLFIDTTGNRRFFPMECSAERRTNFITYDNMRSDENQYEVEQVWAEAYHVYIERCKMYGGTPKACLTSEQMKLVEIAQEQYVVRDDFKDAVFQRLDELYPDVGTRITLAEMRDVINAVMVDFPSEKYQKSSNKIGYILDYHPGEWVRKDHVIITNEDGNRTSVNCIIRAKPYN